MPLRRWRISAERRLEMKSPSCCSQKRRVSPPSRRARKVRCSRGSSTSSIAHGALGVAAGVLDHTSVCDMSSRRESSRERRRRGEPAGASSMFISVSVGRRWSLTAVIAESAAAAAAWTELTGAPPPPPPPLAAASPSSAALASSSMRWTRCMSASVSWPSRCGKRLTRSSVRRVSLDCAAALA